VAVGIGESAFCASADVRKDKRADGLAGQAFEVAAVPGGNCRCENTRLGAKVYLVLSRSSRFFVGAAGSARRCVVSDAKAIAIVWAAVVQT
jgi:hypothetical protein